MCNQSRFMGLALCAVLFSACGGDSAPKTLFPERTACSNVAMTPGTGDHVMVISKLEIGGAQDGFDLDGDGTPDNKFAGVGALAGMIVDPTSVDFSTVLAIEFFDYPTNAADECVKFAMYLSDYTLDTDGDTFLTAEMGGDCDDNDPNTFPGATEIPNDSKDNDCDGAVDETGTPTTTDADGDGITAAAGDCDDNNAMVAPGLDEVCGDGLDNDCDGVADWGLPVCTPFDSATPDALLPQDLSFNMDGSPKIRFAAGSSSQGMNAVELEAGPSLFSLLIDVGIPLDFRITGTTIFGDFEEYPSGLGMLSAKLGGVLDANTLDKITGIDFMGQIAPDDTLLDAIFANLLGTLLTLQKNDMNCFQPDIDVDLDGLEAFCDSDPINADGVKKVDTCIDGDGSIVLDTPTVPCTEAVDSAGDLRFVDGISIEMNFEAVPATLR